jgi:hypothetical protein
VVTTGYISGLITVSDGFNVTRPLQLTDENQAGKGSSTDGTVCLQHSL